jgi:hypothetical protein
MMSKHWKYTFAAVILYIVLFMLFSCSKESNEIKPATTQEHTSAFPGHYHGQIKYTWKSGQVDTTSVTRDIIMAPDGINLLIVWYTSPAVTGQTWMIEQNTYTYETVVFCSPGTSSCGLDAMAYDGTGTLVGDSLMETGTGAYYTGNLSTSFIWSVKAKRQ